MTSNIHNSSYDFKELETDEIQEVVSNKVAGLAAKTQEVADPKMIEKRHELLQEATDHKNYHERGPMPFLPPLPPAVIPAIGRTAKSAHYLSTAQIEDSEEKADARFEAFTGTTSIFTGTGSGIKISSMLFGLSVGGILKMIAMVLSPLAAIPAAIQLGYEGKDMSRQINFEKDFQFETLGLLEKALYGKDKEALKKLMLDPKYSSILSKHDPERKLQRWIQMFERGESLDVHFNVENDLKEVAGSLLKENLKTFQDKYLSLEDLSAEQKEDIQKKAQKFHKEIVHLFEESDDEKILQALSEDAYKDVLIDLLGKEEYREIEDLVALSQKNPEELSVYEKRCKNGKIKEKVSKIAHANLVENFTQVAVDKILQQQLKTLAKRVRPWCASEINQLTPALLQRLNGPNVSDADLKEGLSLMGRVSVQNAKEKNYKKVKMVLAALVIALSIVAATSGIGTPLFILFGVIILTFAYAVYLRKSRDTHKIPEEFETFLHALHQGTLEDQALFEELQKIEEKYSHHHLHHLLHHMSSKHQQQVEGLRRRVDAL